MNINTAQTVVHRGNSLTNKAKPFEQIGFFVEHGFYKIEIDIYALSETDYKFCHPVEADKVDEVYNLNDNLLNRLVERFKNVEWFVDLKCLDLQEVPQAMLRHLVAVFGKSAVFTSAQADILDVIYRAGMRTGQYFKKDIGPTTTFEPDFYILNERESLRYPKPKTIVFCHSLGAAQKFLDRGVIGVMVDGNRLMI